MTDKTKTMREGNVPAKRTVRRSVRESDVSMTENLARLIEDVMDKSEVVLSAQAVTDQLQDMAEKLAMIQAKDIMKMYDGVLTAFGQQVADQWNSVASEQVTQLIAAIQGAKSAMDGEMQRMRKGVEGGDMSDMAMGGQEAPEMGGGEEPGAEMAPGGEAPPGGLPETPPGGDMAGNAEDDEMAMGGGFAGREPKKEAARPRGRTIEGKTWKDSEDANKKRDADKDKARKFKSKQTEIEEGKTWKDSGEDANKKRDADKDKARKFKSKQTEIEEGKTWKDSGEDAKPERDANKDKARKFKSKQTEVEEGKTWKDNEHADPKRDSDKAKARKFKSKQQVEEDVLGGSFGAAPAMSSPRGAPQPAIDRHPHKSVDFPTNLANLANWHGKAGSLARNIEAMIDSESLSGEHRKALANVLSHFAAFAQEPSHWGDADAKLKLSLQAANIWDANETPEVAKVVTQLKKLANFLELHHDGMLESAIRRLRESADPDAMILGVFRKKLAERRDAQLAAIGTARMFAIDIEDVVNVVREAKRAVKEFFFFKEKECPACKGKGKVDGKSCPKCKGTGKIPDDNKKVEEKHIGFKKLERKLSHEKGIKDPAALAASIGRKKFGAEGMAKKAAEGRRFNEENLIQNPTFFPVQSGPSPAPNPPISNPGGATGPQAGPQRSTAPVGGPNQNNSTNRPQTPTDKRMQQQQQTSTSQGANALNAQQPPAGGSTMVPSGETEAGGQIPPSTQTRMAPTQQVNRKAQQQNPMPGGKIVRQMAR